MKDHISTAPSKTDRYGRAWNLDINEAMRGMGVAPSDHATLACWIVEARWAHPIWHSYFFSLVHLRPLADGRETILHRPDATHEFLIHAIDPDSPRQPVIAGEQRVKFLTPCNFGAQLVEPSDAFAISRIAGAVELVIAGELNPDTDAQHQWEALFGNEMIKPEYRRT